MLNDPADRKLRKYERRLSEKRWRSTGRWTLLAVPASPLRTQNDPLLVWSSLLAVDHYQTGLDLAMAGSLNESPDWNYCVDALNHHPTGDS